MQAKGIPVILSFVGSATAVCAFLDADGKVLTINPQQRFILDSFSATLITPAMAGDGADAFLSNTSTGAVTSSTFRVEVLNHPAPLPQVGSGTGGGGEWTAPPQNEGISFSTGITPFMRLSNVAGGVLRFTGTGYIMNVGGYTGWPSYNAPIS